MVDDNLMVYVNETRLVGIMFCVYLAFSVVKNANDINVWYRSHYSVVKPTRVLGVKFLTLKLSPRLLLLMMASFALFLLAYAYSGNRLFGVSALVIYFLVFPSITNFHLIHAKSSNCPIVLSILLISSENHSALFYAQGLGTENETEWGIFFMRLFLGLAYLETGIAKLIASGWKWTKGKALQWYLLEHYLWGGFRFAVPLMQSHPIVLRILSTVTMLIQLSAPIIVLGTWIPAIPIVHGMFAFGFHVSTQIFMGIYFLPFFGPALVSSMLSYPVARIMEYCLDAGLVMGNTETIASGIAHSSAWQICFMAMIPAFQLLCSLTCRVRFPFVLYRLFSLDHSHRKDYGVLLLEFENAAGDVAPWRPLTYYDVRNLSYETVCDESIETGDLSLEDRRRLTKLSPEFDEVFKTRIWKIMEKEEGDRLSSTRCIRVILRYANWDGEIPIGCDDYLVARIHMKNGKPGDIELVERSFVGSRLFPSPFRLGDWQLSSNC